MIIKTGKFREKKKNEFLDFIKMQMQLENAGGLSSSSPCMRVNAIFKDCIYEQQQKRTKE